MGDYKYTMLINITNHTDVTLDPRGAALYNNSDVPGEIKQPPQTVSKRSDGNGGMLAQTEESDQGLFGLVAYSTPDPNRILIIYIAMPQEQGSVNKCWVGLVSDQTGISEALAKTCYEGPPSGFSEDKLSWNFMKDNEYFMLTIEPVVSDPKDWHPSSTVTVDLFKRPSGDAAVA